MRRVVWTARLDLKFRPRRRHSGSCCDSSGWTCYGKRKGSERERGERKGVEREREMRGRKGVEGEFASTGCPNQSLDAASKGVIFPKTGVGVGVASLALMRWRRLRFVGGNRRIPNPLFHHRDIGKRERGRKRKKRNCLSRRIGRQTIILL